MSLSWLLQVPNGGDRVVTGRITSIMERVYQGEEGNRCDSCHRIEHSCSITLTASATPLFRKNLTRETLKRLLHTTFATFKGGQHSSCSESRPAPVPIKAYRFMLSPRLLKWGRFLSGEDDYITTAQDLNGNHLTDINVVIVEYILNNLVVVERIL